MRAGKFIKNASGSRKFFVIMLVAFFSIYSTSFHDKIDTSSCVKNHVDVAAPH